MTEWTHVKNGLPQLRTRVIVGHWYQDKWAKGEPWVFLTEFAMLIPEADVTFPHGRWIGQSCSHSAVEMWTPAPEWPTRIEK